MSLKANDLDSILDTVWNALHSHRETCIPEGAPEYDAQWSDICTAMAWITEDLENYHNAEAE
jgi:hypothetical protein